MTEPLYTVMMVEDNPGDRMLTRLAFEDARLPARFIEVCDGEDALLRLLRRPPHENHERPDLLLLDLNLPKVDGWEVLRVVKADPELRRIPVVVLSSSEAPRDILRVYENQGNSYFVKPIDMGKLGDTVEQIRRYWFTTARLPPRQG